jgi:D-sedoheptulose 7-phosphate isomerase
MIKDIIIEISNNFLNLSENSVDDIDKSANLIIESIKNGNKIMFCGNGGSAADSQHLAAELVGRYRKNRSPLPGIALSTDTSAITAISNDFSFEEIFERQVEAIGKPGDVLYAISTSGKSLNIIKAIEKANSMKLKTIGITGETGGQLSKICDVTIKVPAIRPDRIQEMHIAIGQIICEIIENKFFH